MWVGSRARAGLAIGFVAWLVVASGPAALGSARDAPRVTLIGDSVAEAFAHNPDAVAIVGRGIELKLEVASCRRIELQSCSVEDGVRPPSVLELVKARGAALGPTVIVAVGYNDFEHEYAAAIEAALDALERAGVSRVLWPTLRAARHPHLTMNEAIRAAAERHPELTVVDWNLYSRSHPDWFQADGIHLNAAGVGWMATLFRQALVDLDIPLPPVAVATGRLSDARTGVRYAARVVARGGQAPYRWSFRRLPAGLHASVAGRITGLPRVRAGTYEITATVVDSRGDRATRGITIRVRR